MITYERGRRCTRRLSFNVHQHFCALHIKCASSAAVIYFNTVFWSNAMLSVTGAEQSKGLCLKNTFRKCAFVLWLVLGKLKICIFNHRNASSNEMHLQQITWRNSPKTNQFGSISPLALCDHGMFIPLHEITQSGSVTVEQRAEKRTQFAFPISSPNIYCIEIPNMALEKNTRWTNKKENIATLTVTHGCIRRILVDFSVELAPIMCSVSVGAALTEITLKRLLHSRAYEMLLFTICHRNTTSTGVTINCETKRMVPLMTRQKKTNPGLMNTFWFMGAGGDR